MCSNAIYICISWYSKNWWFSVKKMLSAEFKRCVTWFIYFLVLLWVMHKCHHCRIYKTNFREGIIQLLRSHKLGGFLTLPPPPLFALVCFLDPPPPPPLANVLFSVLAQTPLPSILTPLSSRAAYSSNNMWYFFIKRKYHKLCFVNYQLSTKNPEVTIASIGSPLSNEVEN